jgi:hypothetical protein
VTLAEAVPIVASPVTLVSVRLKVSPESATASASVLTLTETDADDGVRKTEPERPV